MLRYGRENTLDWFRMLDGLLIGVTGNFCRLDVAAAFLFSLFVYFFFVGLASPDCLAVALAAVAMAAAFSWKDFRRCLRKYNIFKVCRNNIWRISFDSFFSEHIKIYRVFLIYMGLLGENDELRQWQDNEEIYIFNLRSLFNVRFFSRFLLLYGRGWHG